MEENIDKDFSRNIWCLLGLSFDAIDMSLALTEIRSAVVQRRRCFLSTPNLNFLIASQSDDGFRQSVINSELSIADGMPLIWMASLLKIPLFERVAGSSLIEQLVNKKSEKPLNIFFFGGEPGVGDKASEKINQLDGGVHAVGCFTPGFGSVEDMSSDEIIDNINQHQIDFLIVSLGAKKGQAWIEHNRKRLDAPVISHLGAVINFYAGTIKRAPVWMQRCGLEWLWRIIEEPFLWRRYFNDGMSFVKLFFCNAVPYAFWLKTHKTLLMSDHPVSIDSSKNLDDKQQSNTLLKLTGACTDKTIFPLRAIFKELAQAGKKVEIDLSGVNVVDGAFIGLCMLLYKYLSATGAGLDIIHLQPDVRRIFFWNKAEFLIDMNSIKA